MGVTQNITFTDATAASPAGGRRLQAVNEMLEAIGDPPVDVLDPGGSSAEGQAEAILGRETRRVLGEGPSDLGGWVCNTLYRKRYTPDGNGHISLPDVTTIKVRENRYGWPSRPIVIRGERAYDMENDTDVFTEDIFLDVVQDLSFDELPPKLADYVTMHSAWVFQRAMKRGSADEQLVRERVSLARLAAHQENGDLSDLRLTQTLEARQVSGFRYGYGRYYP